MAGQHVPVRRRRLGMAPLARLGQHHVDAAPVHVTAAPLDQAVPGQTVYQTRQRALAQVHGLSQFLGAELVLRALGQPVQHLELAHPEAVPKELAGGVFGHITQEDIDGCQIGAYAIADCDGLLIDLSQRPA